MKKGRRDSCPANTAFASSPVLPSRDRHDEPDPRRRQGRARRGQPHRHVTGGDVALREEADRDALSVPKHQGGLGLIVQDLIDNVPAEMGLENDEIEFFVGKLWQVLTSCDARRQEVYETMGWWDFVDASNKSEGYQKFLAEGLTRSPVAANARLANAHVEGDVGLALILDMLIPGASTDRVLNGPTNEVWLHPGWPTWRNGEWTTNSIERSRRSFASQRRAALGDRSSLSSCPTLRGTGMCSTTPTTT